MALVDDDKSQIVDGDKEAAARSDNDSRLAGSSGVIGLSPDPVTLGLGELGVGSEHQVTESGFELADYLLGESNFRDKDYD